IVKNCTREGPGIIEDLLRQSSIPFETIDLEQGEIFPHPKNLSALIVLGGPDSANDNNDKMRNTLKRIQEALSSQIPYFGICLGLQLLVKAGGGAVVKNPVKEIGFRDPNKNFFKVNLTLHGKSDPLCGGLEGSLKIFHLHGETVELTEKMTLLGTGEFCRNQIVRINPLAYGIQGHLELTEELFRVWVKEDPELAVLSQSDLAADYRLLQKELFKTGSTLFNNFLVLAELTKKKKTN
ncbi:MAG: type 1 glutamine amidotransferase, partial [Nitrospirae bacterium]|nr:type 1 glutamine amidotransferase [Nitrospirota bacterium]